MLDIVEVMAIRLNRLMKVKGIPALPEVMPRHAACYRW